MSFLKEPRFPSSPTFSRPQSSGRTSVSSPIAMVNSQRSQTTHSFLPSTASIQSSESETSLGQNDMLAPSELPDLFNAAYAKKCRALVQLIRELNDLGAVSLSLDLPRITVIGAQSAGKSSLVEAVSGIDVPRDSGTCTRCPMELNISSDSKTWSCEISLRLEYDGEGEKLTTSEVKSFSPTIVDKESVALWLRRAQMVLLNPHLSADFFKRKSAQDLREHFETDAEVLKFSRNVILVSVRDPEATDLIFVDLPGLIQNAEPSLISAVQSMVVDSIQTHNTLVIVTIPISDDMENQQAMRLAREEDPNGERTIGILTKPDTLPSGASGSRQAWKDILEGRKHHLKHGYYCVLLPDDQQREQRIPRSEVQRKARDFFDATTPWNEIRDRSCFGISNFIATVSSLLVHRIDANIPETLRKVENMLREDKAELNKLPVSHTGDPLTEISVMLNKFCGDIGDAFVGTSSKKFVQDNKQHYEQFRQRIQDTCPDFRPFDDYTLYRDPMIRTRHADMGKSEIFDLEYVRRIIERSITFQLPGYVSFEVCEGLILAFINCWDAPSELCFNSVFEALSGFLKERIRYEFRQFKQLEILVSTLTREVVDSCKTEAKNLIRSILDMQKLPVYTQNTHYFSAYKDKWSSKYRDLYMHRDEYLEKNFSLDYDSQFSPPIRPMRNLSSHHVATPREQSPIRDIAFEDELNVMATVRAYFQVAYKRIIDNIPLAIEHALNQAIARQLPAILTQNILGGYNTGRADRLSQLLSEDPDILAGRQRLEKRIERLEEIRQKLIPFTTA